LWIIRIDISVTCLFIGFSGPPGENGRDGADGRPGLPGASALFHGYFLTKHSQTSDVPECPLGMNKLWDGYSLLFIQGNERAHGQDLGKFIDLFIFSFTNW